MSNFSNNPEEFISPDEDETNKQFSNDVIEYSSQVESIITYLFEKEAELQGKASATDLQNAPFNQVLGEYSQHEKFISEFCEYSHTVMKCKEEGQEMRENLDLYTDEDRDEIGIQIDTMEVCYEKLKILATDRLQSLQRILEERQQTKIERFEEWLSNMDSKIAISTNIGPDFEAIKRQAKDLSDLKLELEQKQDFLNFMSNVIIFDDVDTDSLQLKTRSCASLDDRLEKMNRRWTEICRYVDERDKKLKKASTIWKLLDIEGPQLLNWFRKVQKNLEELSEASKSAADLRVDDVFAVKLMSRSEKIDQDIKDKQSFYTSLESRVRIEIENFDDPCSMLVIELEKKLEDMRDCWNAILNRKRMLDFTIQALAKSDQHHEINGKLLQDRIISQNQQVSTEPFRPGESFSPPVKLPNQFQSNGTFVEHLNNSSSSSNDEKDSSSHHNVTNSDPRAFDNSLSSDTRSIACGSNQDRSLYDNNDSQDDFSSTSMTTSFPTNPMLMSNSDTSKDLNHPELIESKTKEPQLDWHRGSSSDHTGTHNCRVEELKNSIESFSSWLKQVETSLGVDTSLDAIVSSENGQSTQCWLKLDPHRKLLLLIDVEKQIVTSCQDEFDCLILQGEQIIEDLLPEFRENDYGIDPKQILADLDQRYSNVKKTIDQHKQELADVDHWQRLLKTLKDESEKLIRRMSLVISESSIGVDLITLAQQQDELIHMKTDLEESIIIQSSVQESKLFLRFCDTLQQQLDILTQKSASLDGLKTGQELYVRQHRCNQAISTLIYQIWQPMKGLKEEVKNQLDRLNIHYSDLLQLIEDRLVRLEEVHKEMHSLQHRMQDLAAKLQVAEILRSNWPPLEDLSIEKLSEQLEDLKLFRERLGEVESTHRVMNTIFDWMTKSDIPLSHQNVNRINELDAIWNMIQVSVEERQRQIEEAFDYQGASEQKFLEQTVSDLPLWERRVATSKIPYFVDHETNKTHWDHPKFDDLLRTMSSVNQIVYAAYRTAFKLRMLQKTLGIDLLMLEQLKEIVDTSLNELPEGDSMKTSETSKRVVKGQITGSAFANSDELVGVEQIISVLKAIYQKIQGEEKTTLNVPLSIDLTLNWLLNLYDS